MKKIKLIICMLMIFSVSFAFVSCTFVNKIEVKLGFKNEEFEYLNTNSVEEISIQSTRDPGFKFIVTENHAIKEMYKLLTKAKRSETKSELSPDYIFKFDLGDEVKEFYYIVGAEDGNLYNDNIVYSVSNRLDESLIQNLSIIKNPRNFEDVYYQTIIDVLKLHKDIFNNGGHKVGINIQGDVEILKYVFSVDIENFLREARKIVPNLEMVNNNAETFDAVLTVKNRGYDKSTYNTKISVNNKIDKIQEDFYIMANYKYREWIYEISKPNEKPQGW